MSNAKPLGQVYAKIGVYCGIEAPMHFHSPYTYWQWPWERHTKDGADHDLHDVKNPVWVGNKVSNPTKAGVATRKPTAAEAKLYAEALDPNSAVAKATVARYQAYLKAKASGKPVAAPALSEVDEEGALVN